MNNLYRWIKWLEVRIYLLLASPFALILILVTRLLKPFIRVQFIDIRSHSMSMIQVCEAIRVFEQNGINILYSSGKNSNKKLLKILFENTYFSRQCYYVFKSVEVILSKLNMLHQHTMQYTCNELSESISKFEPRFDSLYDEVFLRKECFEKLGIPEDAPIVCLMIRDNEYMRHFMPERDDSDNNCRNADIEDFIPAIKELVHRGYYVVRMGIRVEKPLSFKNLKVIDYAYENMRTEEMDIYLGGRCDFCLTTAAGWDSIPSILFGKPMCYVNVAGLLENLYFCCRKESSIYVPKKYFNSEKSRILSAYEIMSLNIGLIHSAGLFDLEKRNISFLPNSPEEIKEAVCEIVDKLQNKWVAYPEDDLVQEKFWNMLEKRPEYIPAKLSSSYLRKNKDWLLCAES